MHSKLFGTYMYIACDTLFKTWKMHIVTSSVEYIDIRHPINLTPTAGVRLMGFQKKNIYYPFNKFCEALTWWARKVSWYVGSMLEKIAFLRKDNFARNSNSINLTPSDGNVNCPSPGLGLTSDLSATSDDVWVTFMLNLTRPFYLNFFHKCVLLTKVHRFW